MPTLTIRAAGFQANRAVISARLKQLRKEPSPKLCLCSLQKTRSDFNRCEVAEPSRLPAPHGSPTSLIVLLFCTAYKL